MIHYSFIGYTSMCSFFIYKGVVSLCIEIVIPPIFVILIDYICNLLICQHYRLQEHNEVISL